MLDHRAHFLKLGTGRLEQRLAFGGAQLGQLGIAAGDQPLAGIIGMRELEQIALVEQSQLQAAGLDQQVNLCAFERRDPGTTPVKPLSSSIDLCEIMPRSPTTTMVAMPNCWRTRSTCASRVVASPVLPSNTDTATGQPRASVTRP